MYVYVSVYVCMYVCMCIYICVPNSMNASPNACPVTDTGLFVCSTGSCERGRETDTAEAVFDDDAFIFMPTLRRAIVSVLVLDVVLVLVLIIVVVVEEAVVVVMVVVVVGALDLEFCRI
jgi:hypothetical protein